MVCILSIFGSFHPSGYTSVRFNWYRLDHSFDASWEAERMTAFLSNIIGKLGSFISFLSGLEVVSGVSLLGIMGGLIILGVLINNFVLRGRG